MPGWNSPLRGAIRQIKVESEFNKFFENYMAAATASLATSINPWGKVPR